MKRDMEVVRQILLAVERDQTTTGQQLRSIHVTPTTEVSEDVVTYHVRLLMEAAYLTGDPHQPTSALESALTSGRGYGITGITWQGHEFLDAIRDDVVWKKD